MQYSKFISDAKQKTIDKLENGIWYLNPEWKDIICREIENDVNELEDSYLADWWDVENILKLEVERRNAQDSKKPEVINWLYELINSTIDPAMLEEESDLFKNMVEYMKVNHNLSEESPEQ